MKQILLNIAAVAFSAFFSIGALKAQTVTILELKGTNDDFVFQDWTVTGSGSLVNAHKVSIGQGESGTLAIDNTSSYKNIKVQVQFSQTPSISFDISLNAGSEAATGIISGNVGGVNTANIPFNNPNGIVLNELKISNPSMTAGVIYLKITGELDGTNAVLTEDMNSFDVRVNNESLIIHSETEGTLNIYNSIGQFEGTYTLIKGENTIMNSTKGMLFLVLSNSNIESISRKKIMR